MSPNLLSPPPLTGIVLAMAALLACSRLLYRHLRRDRTLPSNALRLYLLLPAQPALAALLYLGLFPPAQPIAAGTMTVLTAGARTASDTLDALRIALPEAPADPDAEAAPDLATALRRHPGVTDLRIVGAGLEARDLDAARGHALHFDGQPPATGIVALEAPASVATGNAFAVRGRIAGFPNAEVELLDPAGQRMARTTMADDGRFSLQGTTRGAGLATFRLRLLDAAGRTRETLPLPLQVVAPPPPRLLVLAGAPDPELKYLRRWAVDAGIQLHTRVGIGAGLVLGDAPLALDADTLRRFDAVLLDARSLQALTDGETRALTAAVRAGLGLLLRIDGPLSSGARARLRGWGYALEDGARMESVRLAFPVAGQDAPALARRALRVQAADALTLLPDAKRQPIAWWRPLGRGRIAVTALADSFRLPLAGHGDTHARLWSGLLAAIARTPDSPSTPSLPSPVWPDQRAVFCGLMGEPSVLAPDGTTLPLAVDPATGAHRCAAFWPRQAGWHLLRQGDAQIPFPVLPAETGLAWQAQRRFDATSALVAARADAPDPAAAAGAGRPQRGPSWPWLAAWLLLAACCWWLERRRPSSHAVPPRAP